MDSKKQEALDIATGAIKVAVKTLERAASMSAAERLDAARTVLLHLQYKQMVLEPLLMPVVRCTIEYKGVVLRGVHQEHDVWGLMRAVDTYLSEGTAVLPADVTIELLGGAQ